MKKFVSFVAYSLLIGFGIGCQNGDQSAIKPIKRDVGAGARRACGIVYGILKPTDDYTYNGTGCVSYYIHRGTTRQFKVKMTNPTGGAIDVSLELDHPDNPGNIQWSVASVTAGYTSTGSPVPGTNDGAYVSWYANLPAYTTYEMIVNLTGVTGSGASEQGIKLNIKGPCVGVNSDDCDQDDNMHVVLAD